MRLTNLIFKKRDKLVTRKILIIFTFFSLLNFHQSNAEDLINHECIRPTSSQVQTNGLDLHIPYALVNGKYFHAEFDYIGNLEGVLTWKLSNAVESRKPIPSPCSTTVTINGDQVFLADVVAMQNTVFTDTHYDANLTLVSNADGIFLKLVNYSILPKQVKLIMAVAGSEKKITLVWVLKDEISNSMKYLLHAANEPSFRPDNSTLVKEIQGARQVQMTDLIPGTVYYFKIITEDATGLQSIVSNTLSARTFASPVVLNSTENVKQASELKLVNIKNSDGNNLTFTLTGNEALPANQSILLGETAKGGGYLRRIESSTQSNGELHLTTSQASLSDIFDTGSLSNSILLTNISDNSQSKNKTIKQWKIANNSRVSQLKWDNDLLEITQTNHAYNSDKLTITPEENGRSFKFDVKPEISNQARSLTHQLSTEISIDSSIDFEPIFETEVDWSSNKLNSAKVKVGGTLSINLAVEFDFKGLVSYTSPTKRILTKTYTAKYFIGAVPVWQVTTFTLDAQVSAQAESAIHANTNVNASASVALGMAYDRGEWSTISNPITLERSITADISVKGKVNAEVRLIPNIETRFYGLTSVNISVEPYLEGEIASEPNDALIVNIFPELTQQLTSFDVNIGLECFTNIDFKTIFGTIPILERTKICGEGSITGLIEYPLFSLPELSITSEQQGARIVSTANTIDGINNPFDIGSINWFTEPAGPVISSTGKTMSFSPVEGVEEYKIFLSGYGRLGAVARQVVISDSQFIINGSASPGSDIPNGVDNSPKNLTIKLIDGENLVIRNSKTLEMEIESVIEIPPVGNEDFLVAVASFSPRICDIPTSSYKHGFNSFTCNMTIAGDDCNGDGM